MTIKDWWRAFRPATGTAKAPLVGISLRVEETRALRIGPVAATSVEELEIGATGPNELQFVLISRDRRATIKLSAQQARWLAGALTHWADSSEAIPLH